MPAAGAPDPSLSLPAARRSAQPLRVPIPDVGAERILRMHGYPDPQRARPRIRRAAERMAALARDIGRGEARWRCVAAQRSGTGELSLAGGEVLHCPAFDHYLRDCGEVVLFVLTAGSAFDERIAGLMDEEQPVDALFLDTAGWLAVEAVTRRLAAGLKAAAVAEGARLTRRMAPGYGYRVERRPSTWALEEQHALFRALGGTGLPVTLLDSAAMCPKMSRSGLFGLRRGPDALPGGAARA